MPFVWAAYKKGSLASMGPDFEDGEMDSATFAARFTEEIELNYDAAWTQLVEGQKYPVGVIFGFWPHRDDTSPYMIVGDIIRFPWASVRNKVETTVNFFNEMREHWPFIQYAPMDEKEFFEMIAKHGVMRRVGTSHSIYPGQPSTVFETRAR